MFLQSLFFRVFLYELALHIAVFFTSVCDAYMPHMYAYEPYSRASIFLSLASYRFGGGVFRRPEYRSFLYATNLRQVYRQLRHPLYRQWALNTECFQDVYPAG